MLGCYVSLATRRRCQWRLSGHLATIAVIVGIFFSGITGVVEKAEFSGPMEITAVAIGDLANHKQGFSPLIHSHNLLRQIEGETMGDFHLVRSTSGRRQQWARPVGFLGVSRLPRTSFKGGRIAGFVASDAPSHGQIRPYGRQLPNISHRDPCCHAVSRFSNFKQLRMGWGAFPIFREKLPFQRKAAINHPNPGPLLTSIQLKRNFTNF